MIIKYSRFREDIEVFLREGGKIKSLPSQKDKTRITALPKTSSEEEIDEDEYTELFATSPRPSNNP